jgi:hypothetical protein
MAGTTVSGHFFSFGVKSQLLSPHTPQRQNWPMSLVSSKVDSSVQVVNFKQVKQ